MPLCLRPSRSTSERGWSKGFYLFSKFSCNLGKTHALGARDPFKTKPGLINAQDINQFPGHAEHLLCLYITIQVMTVADVSPSHQHAVGAGFKGLQNKVGIDPARTHHPDNPHIGRILKPAHPRKISSGIGAPVARKRNNFRFKSFGHNKTPVSTDNKKIKHFSIVNHQLNAASTMVSTS
jgi:hypothetical protein